MIQNIFYILFLIIFILIIFYIFGLSLINIIENKLKNIKVDINYKNNIESFDNKLIKKETNEDIEISNLKKYNFLKGNLLNNSENNLVSNNKDEKIKTNFNNDYYKKNQKNKVEGFSIDPLNEYKEWNVEKKRTQVCIKNHIHKKDGRDLNCTYGVTNYSDPTDMSPFDLNLFQLNYPPNMTLQDYINWLYCFIDKEDQLPYNHLKNLEKLKLGKELIEEEGILPPPGYVYPPKNSEDYFNKMYNNVNEFQIASPLNSTTAPMLGYNYNEYSEFEQNMDLKGWTGELRNPDIGLKKNAKKLYNYINPQNSNSINIDNDNQIYRMKNIEI
jgi:hypothetical protein